MFRARQAYLGPDSDSGSDSDSDNDRDNDRDNDGIDTTGSNHHLETSIAEDSHRHVNDIPDNLNDNNCNDDSVYNTIASGSVTYTGNLATIKNTGNECYIIAIIHLFQTIRSHVTESMSAIVKKLMELVDTAASTNRTFQIPKEFHPLFKYNGSQMDFFEIFQLDAISKSNFSDALQFDVVKQRTGLNGKFYLEEQVFDKHKRKNKKVCWKESEISLQGDPKFSFYILILFRYIFISFFFFLYFDH